MPIEVAVAKTLAAQIADAADRPGPDLAAPAFLIARIEYRHLDPGPYLDRIDIMGDAAVRRSSTSLRQLFRGSS